MKNIRTMFLFLFILFCVYSFPHTSFGEPKDISSDVSALLGIYQTEGENILIREKKGGLELLYGVTEYDFSFDKSNVFQMVKYRYDEYEVVLSSPRDYRLVVIAKFERNKEGKGITCIIDRKRYNRNFYLGDNANKLNLIPNDSYENIKTNAINSAMPSQDKVSLAADLVEIIKVDPSIKVDMMYARENDFIKMKMYEEEKAYLDKGVAKALSNVNKKLSSYGYGIIVWDAYRPWYVSKMFNMVLPDDKKKMIEDPEKGSPHNTGFSVDISLYDLETGKPVDMISGFDEISLRAFRDYQGGSELQRYRRNLLRTLMEGEGFTGVDHEWWHYNFKDFNKYKLLNFTFSELSKK